MKLLSYSHDGRSSFGAVIGSPEGDVVVDLSHQLDGVLDLSDLLTQRCLLYTSDAADERVRV